MRQINKLCLYALALVAVIILVPNNIWSASADGTSISVQPATTTVADVGFTFNIEVTISQVTDLAGWDFQIYYPNALLNATKLKEGPFLKQAGSTSNLTRSFTDSYNATHGRIWFVCTLIGQGPGANGNGVLATITFKTKSGGDGILHLGETDLVDSVYPPNHITHTTNDGTVHVTAGIKDVAVTNVIPLKTIVGWSYPLRTEVTVENQGSYGVSFNVTLYAKKLPATIDNINLYADDALGWGLTLTDITSPGPTITVNKGDVVNLTLLAQDLAPRHNFFVDYNGDRNPSPNEPKSPDFYSPYRQTINYRFTADILGTFTYYCEYSENVMYGTFIVAPTYIQTIEVGMQLIFLNSGASGNLTYVWDTSGISSKGYYDLTTYAWPLPGEGQLDNNNFTYRNFVTLTIPGDINGDFLVNIGDVGLITANWQKHSPPAPAAADINGNGIINIGDVGIVTAHWQQHA